DQPPRPDRIRCRTQSRASAPGIPAVEYSAHASTPPHCAPRVRPQATMLALSSYSELMPQLLRTALLAYDRRLPCYRCRRIRPSCLNTSAPPSSHAALALNVSTLCAVTNRGRPATSSCSTTSPSTRRAESSPGTALECVSSCSTATPPPVFNNRAA